MIQSIRKPVRINLVQKQLMKNDNQPDSVMTRIELTYLEKINDNGVSGLPFGEEYLNDKGAAFNEFQDKVPFDGVLELGVGRTYKGRSKSQVLAIHPNEPMK